MATATGRAPGSADPIRSESVLPQAVERIAPAKINLALHVLRQRADGYHDLDTLAVFADLGDTLIATAASDLALSIFGTFAGHAPPGEDNLVMRASRLLQQHAQVCVGAAIRLEKRLPAGAGLGGGTADAAAALHALNELWRLGLSVEELCALGSEIGADMAMCLTARPLRAGGTGDRIELRQNWPELPLVLIWPGTPVSTPLAFAGLSRRENPPLPILPDARTPAEFCAGLAQCRNDLEEPATDLVPKIGDVLHRLRRTKGCLLARMSGSGSGCFGIYSHAAEAREAAVSLRAQEPGWWIASTIANPAEA